MDSRYRQARHVSLSSSSSSEAAEDSAPESDIDSPMRKSDFAATNDMSDRQTQKLNSGKFGMFNPATLGSGTSRTLGSSRKRSRVERDIATPASKRRSRQRVEGSPDTVHRGEDNGESLFIPDDTSPPQYFVADDESDLDNDLYSDLTPERAQAVKDYLAALKAVDQTNSKLRATQNALNLAIISHTSLSEKLANLQATADDSMANIIRERDETIRIANECAESRIKKIRDRVPERRERYEERLHRSDAHKIAMEQLLKDESAAGEAAEVRKRELEVKGGFGLCNDVRDIQAKRG